MRYTVNSSKRFAIIKCHILGTFIYISLLSLGILKNKYKLSLFYVGKIKAKINLGQY